MKRLLSKSYSRCLIFVVVLSAVFSLLSPYFLSAGNLDNILAASAVIGLLALGATFIIASGEIDLSIASVMALSGTVCAFFVQDSETLPMLAVLIAAGVGLLCGLATALLINLTRAPSFIVTLGMLSVTRALAYIISDGTPIYGLPEEITALGQGEVMGISASVVFLLVLAIIAHVILAKTVFGARVLAAGDNLFAAKAMGIDLSHLRVLNYSLAGVFSGMAGFIFMARTNCGDPTAGQNYELIAITAVILGGARLFGGKATIIGTLLGVVCLGVLQNGLNLLAVSSYYQVLFVGVVLLSAAMFDRGASNESA